VHKVLLEDALADASWARARDLQKVGGAAEEGTGCYTLHTTEAVPHCSPSSLLGATAASCSHHHLRLLEEVACLGKMAAGQADAAADLGHSLRTGHICLPWLLLAVLGDVAGEALTVKVERREKRPSPLALLPHSSSSSSLRFITIIAQQQAALHSQHHVNIIQSSIWLPRELIQAVRRLRPLPRGPC
jgi:hypothetical protein